MQVIVHGGAGGPADEPRSRQRVLDDAAAAGAGQPTPLDAVETAVRTLESDPQFNAGVGSAVQSDGVIRTDAGLMTDDRRVGAACSMAGVEYAVSAARVVLAETPHVLLAGDEAVDLAGEFGVETGVDLWTDRTRGRWAAADPPTGAGVGEQLSWIDSRFGAGGDDRDEEEDDTAGGDDPPARGDGGTAGGNPPSDPRDHDTVGAVARDGMAFAAATSTGGRWFALAGRVGDVPQVGSGFYCGPAGGASATGAGEDIARVTLARRAVDLLADHDAEGAASEAIAEFENLTGSTAGIVVLDADGAGSAYNSEAMQTSVASE